MADDLVFMPGDTVEFAVELSHDFNISDAWAVFLLHQEREGFRRVPLVLDGRTVEEVERTGTRTVSRIVFQAELTQGNQIPGLYELEQVRALPPGYHRSLGARGIELGTADVSFRIESTPQNPTAALRSWGLGHGGSSRRYFD